MSRVNYYARRRLRKRRRVEEDLVVALVRQERSVQPRLGVRKLVVLVKEALAKAEVKLGRDRFFEVLRDHSDRGCQYCCHEYVALARSREVVLSMTEVEHCAENAMAERMNGILKSEYGLDQWFKTKELTKKAVKQAIYLYGNRRPHTALNYQFPARVHAQEFPPGPPSAGA